ncbi:hypothetical protein ACEPPN_002606 [Leptodophora sp. 'Broadleaf-Isolate-01']
MAPKTLAFKCALVTGGGGGGIGLAMAQHLISLGKSIILTSARKSSKEHPEGDCLINNAALQRPFDINKFDLENADQEIDINRPMHLTIGFLEHFKRKEAATIVNISSLLGYVPTSIISPLYNATKAWVHFWTMNSRTQLGSDEGGRNSKVVEVAPPTVATNLHRDRKGADDNKKATNLNALELPEFMKFVAKGWEQDKGTIGAGRSAGVVDRWYVAFEEDYREAASGQEVVGVPDKKRNE